MEEGEAGRLGWHCAKRLKGRKRRWVGLEKQKEGENGKGFELLCF
jgi:hypothetical protein